LARSTEFRNQARKTLLQIGHRLRREAAKRAPKKTTDLARSIIVRAVDRWAVEVGPTVDYGLYVHEGTGKYGPKKRPYKIEPKRKKALKFKKQGSTFTAGGSTFTQVGRNMIRKSVIHPGIKPQPFMDDAWRDTADWAQAKLAEDLGEAALKDLGLEMDKTW